MKAHVPQKVGRHTSPRLSWVVRWRRWLKPFISKQGTTEAIAGGVAIGFFIALTPTIGVQLILAYLVATCAKASRAAALVPVWITSPLTIPAIYTFTYKVGTFFVEGPPVQYVRIELIRLVRKMYDYETLDLQSRIRDALQLSREIYVPMLIGGIVIGSLAALISYPITLWAVRRLRRRRKERRERRTNRFRHPLRHKRDGISAPASRDK